MESTLPSYFSFQMLAYFYSVAPEIAEDTETKEPMQASGKFLKVSANS